MNSKNSHIFVVLPHGLAPPAIRPLARRSCLPALTCDPHWAEPESMVRQCNTASPRSGDLPAPGLFVVAVITHGRRRVTGLSETRSSFGSLPGTGDSPGPVPKCHPQILALAAAMPQRGIHRMISRPVEGWHLSRTKTTGESAPFLDQPVTRNEVILKECRQYSAQMLANAATHCKDSRVAKNVAVQMRESGCLAVCITVRPRHVCKHLNPSRPKMIFAEFGSLRPAKAP